MKYCIRAAKIDDADDIARIGSISVELAHRESCSVEDMVTFLGETYSLAAIQSELTQPENVYHVLEFEDTVVGFSKVILNAKHKNIARADVMKLDRIYLLPQYFDQKLGVALFHHCLNFATDHKQVGIWLFTWVGNLRALEFYSKAGFKIIGAHRFKVTDKHYNDHHQMFLNLRKEQVDDETV